ncbi:cystatin-F isoform X3 [Rhinopithecus roxellana]|uniref:Cystatin F n=1 Tax=Rhinopithecus roxellana TaxID=61622 RepID=A0A2K6Q5S5_RHIRO|nr:cystatin-F isoform X3 [Rhinopithecus roxellana]
MLPEKALHGHPRLPRTVPTPTAMRAAGALLAFCCLVVSTTGGPSPDTCSQDLIAGVNPGFPKTIKTNDPGVLQAARYSVEKFNNCTNDMFLFKESRITRALVQIVKGLKYMLEVEIGRTTCKKNQHPRLDDCDFQTNHTLKQTLSCYSEVWVVPWLQHVEVPVLRCH